MGWKAKESYLCYQSVEENLFDFKVKETVKTYSARILKPYFASQSYPVKLFKGDSLEILKKVPSECVDLIFADPPYFLSNGGITCHAGKMVSVNKGNWDVSKGAEKDHEFNLKWLAQCQRILKPNGTIWISGTSHIIYSVGFALNQLNFKILNDIIWYKRNAPPNLSCRYFTHSTEIIIWAAKNKKSKHTFNYQLMREINNGKQMRNLWEISPPSKAEKKYGKHPTQKPLALLERIILASSNAGDLVVDPFCGSGTTGVAAVLLGRKFVGIDIEENYLKIAIMRIEEAIKERKKQALQRDNF
jgi:site-specific DNA-methyltransferase (adenine-specific)